MKNSFVRAASSVVMMALLAAGLADPSISWAAPKSHKKAAAKAPAKTTAPKQAAPKAPPAPVSCKAELLMEPQSGEVLYENNSHQPLPPASMTKLMTAYVTLKRVQQGAAKLSDLVTASAQCAKMGGSQVYLKQGEQFSLQELLEAMLIQSGNDAAFAIAEYLGGSVEGFVDMMNTEAKALGMKESEFHSAHGLPPSKGQLPDLVSANDMAILARALLQSYPQVLTITSKSEQPFRNGAFIMRNHNHVLLHYQGCDGLKTGYYGQAGFCITTTAQRNGMRMLAVVMGCGNLKFRDAEASRLMSQGFAQFRPVTLIEKGAAIGEAVPVKGGKTKEVVPVAASGLVAAAKIGDDQKIEKKTALCAGLTAPVAQNAPCGTVAFYQNGKELGSVDLVVPQAVEAGGVADRLWRIVGQ